jgi:hypothetical protein
VHIGLTFTNRKVMRRSYVCIPSHVTINEKEIEIVDIQEFSSCPGVSRYGIIILLLFFFLVFFVVVKMHLTC